MKRIIIRAAIAVSAVLPIIACSASDNLRLAAPPPNPIPTPTAVSIQDNRPGVGIYSVIAIYAVIDLTKVTIVTPDPDQDPCRVQFGSQYAVARTLGPDAGRIKGKSPAKAWSQTLTSIPTIAINGGFFRPDTPPPQRTTAGEACYIVNDPDSDHGFFGYTVSEGKLVQPERWLVGSYWTNGHFHLSATTLRISYGSATPYITNAVEIEKSPLAPEPADNVPFWLRSAITGVPLIHKGVYVGPALALATPGSPATTGTGPKPECPLPRTAIGTTRDGSSLVIVVVNNGDDNWECGYTNPNGVTLAGLANFMLSKGVFNAINLDGGGSSQLYYAGKTVTQPSDGENEDGYPAPADTKYYRIVPYALGFR